MGCFPGGASPYGVEDLSGNVWEWTRSHWKDYPYAATDGREDLSAGDAVLRVVRGGSFNHDGRDVRCASRSGWYPYNRGGDLGFRVVVVPPVLGPLAQGPFPLASEASGL